MTKQEINDEFENASNYAAQKWDIMELAKEEFEKAAKEYNDAWKEVKLIIEKIVSAS